MDNTVHGALAEGFTDPVRDVLWGHIYLTPPLAALAASAPFLRLTRIMQLGPVFRVYPGATHTRASHSTGVYHLGRRLLQNLAGRGAEQWLTHEGVRSFLCACLLHDMGHFPYTHSLKELPLRSHESLTGDIIVNEPVKSLVGDCGADPYFTAAIVDRDRSVENGAQAGNAELLFYRKLLSGCLDPDKLDYLNRDARYCGVPYGVQDADFILSRLSPHKERGADIDSRLIPNVESILFSKYLMYRTIYWHRQVRSATAMIKKALLAGLEAGLFCGEELYGLDDQSLFSLLEERSGRKSGTAAGNAAGTSAGSAASPGILAGAVREGRLYALAAELPRAGAEAGGIRNIRNRSRCEGQLAAALNAAGLPLSPDDLVIDVPEPLSFETGLFVLDENCAFQESSSAFKSETLDSFVRTLYTVRIYINPVFEQNLKTLPGFCDIIHRKEWLREA